MRASRSGGDAAACRAAGSASGGRSCARGPSRRWRRLEVVDRQRHDGEAAVAPQPGGQVAVLHDRDRPEPAGAVERGPGGEQRLVAVDDPEEPRAQVDDALEQRAAGRSKRIRNAPAPARVSAAAIAAAGARRQDACRRAGRAARRRTRPPRPRFIAAARLPGAVTTVAPAAAAAAAVPSPRAGVDHDHLAGAERPPGRGDRRRRSPAASSRVGITTEIVMPGPGGGRGSGAGWTGRATRSRLTAMNSTNPQNHWLGARSVSTVIAIACSEPDDRADAGVPAEQQQHARDRLDERTPASRRA